MSFLEFNENIKKILLSYNTFSSVNLQYFYIV